MEKTLQVELAGRRVWVTERTARQALAFTEYVNPETEQIEAGEVPNYLKAVYANALIIHDAAEAYNMTLPKWNFWRRWWQSNSAKTKRLIDKVGANSLGDLALEILMKCEDLDPSQDSIKIKKKTLSP